MKKLLFATLLLTLVAAGCAITNYPVITDTRGGYSGVIRTGHKAYITPSIQTATIWPDGSDELFTMVYQSQFGDQKLYTFDNFDPTGSVIFLDKTYCDWRYSGCEIVRAWNPANDAVDNIFDYEYFPQCPGARSLSILLSVGSRIKECGDGLWADKQALLGEFANLATTTWRGGTAYIVPIDSSNTTITLTTNTTSQTMPLFGAFNIFVNDKLQAMVPMTPNARNELRWLSSFVSDNGREVNAAVTYNSLQMNFNIAIALNGINYNLTRF